MRETRWNFKKKKGKKPETCRKRKQSFSSNESSSLVSPLAYATLTLKERRIGKRLTQARVGIVGEVVQVQHHLLLPPTRTQLEEEVFPSQKFICGSFERKRDLFFFLSSHPSLAPHFSHVLFLSKDLSDETSERNGGRRNCGVVMDEPFGKGKPSPSRPRGVITH